MDESTFILGATGVTFHFYFAFYYTYIGSGTAGDKDVPGLHRYRTDAIPVETRLLPASSRLITVFDSLPGYAKVSHSRIERRISHGYYPASFVAICTGP